jgi:hypothetical protein
MFQSLSRRNIKPVIENFACLCAPSGFKSNQPGIFRLGAPEAKLFEPVFRKPPDRLPHNQVVGPQALESQVRCAEFVNAPFARMKIDGPGNGPPLIAPKDRKAFALRDRIAVDCSKKSIWLGRRAMAMSGKAMQPVILMKVAFKVGNGYANSRLLRRADVSPGVGFYAAEKQFFLAVNFQNMPQIAPIRRRAV